MADPSPAFRLRRDDEYVIKRGSRQVRDLIVGRSARDLQRLVEFELGVVDDEPLGAGAELQVKSVLFADRIEPVLGVDRGQATVLIWLGRQIHVEPTQSAALRFGGGPKRREPARLHAQVDLDVLRRPAAKGHQAERRDLALGASPAAFGINDARHDARVVL